jgi:hypothetical protein
MTRLHARRGRQAGTMCRVRTSPVCLAPRARRHVSLGHRPRICEMKNVSAVKARFTSAACSQSQTYRSSKSKPCLLLPELVFLLVGRAVLCTLLPGARQRRAREWRALPSAFAPSRTTDVSNTRSRSHFFPFNTLDPFRGCFLHLLDEFSLGNSWR